MSSAPVKKDSVPNSLTIVIPALNEEDAIGSTISRCIDAKEKIKNAAGLSEIEIIVVSDGSTDNTVKIAQGFKEVKLIVFKQNRGYGAAIKEGWKQGKGTLLAFLDADGTCDPENFGEMCRISLEESAEVVLGSRLGPESKMPKTRRLGNRIYALILGWLCGRAITDTASGMRVVQRKALKYLYPLPDGLHFTPSMSTRALLNDLRVIEIPMSYQERIGESKLNVFRDGVYFLKTIFDGLLCYRPEKLLLISFVFCTLFLIILAASPSEFYFKQHRLEEWMIYRFVVCGFLGSVSLMLLLAVALTNQVAIFGPRRTSAASFWTTIISKFFTGKGLTVLSLLLLIVAFFFLWPGIIEYIVSGHVTLHWSRLLMGAFSLILLAQTAITGLIIKVVNTWMSQITSLDQ